MNPWMSKEEIASIVPYLHKNGTMLEYGCGGSTLYFCDYVKNYYSVEHDQAWYNKIKELSKNKRNTTIFHVARNHETPDNLRFTPNTWNMLESSSRSKDFNEYIKFPQKIECEFDFVLIDGRARPECAKFIINHIHKDSIVFMHDYWNRKYYHVVEEKYKVIDSVKTGQSIVVLQKR